MGSKMFEDVFFSSEASVGLRILLRVWSSMAPKTNSKPTRGALVVVLGAGASVDSGFPTYRGPGSSPPSNSKVNDPWEGMDDILKVAATHPTPGPTYEALAELIPSYSKTILLNQNVDGLATKMAISLRRKCSGVDVTVVPLHGTLTHERCTSCKHRRALFVSSVSDHRCPECANTMRPDIVLQGEEILFPPSLHRTLKTLAGATVLVVGTTLHYPYLRAILSRLKQRQAVVTHINPDLAYDGCKGNETWIRASATQGLAFLTLPPC
jgi:NAD-dependent SIR2 family protein deacetylase